MRKNGYQGLTDDDVLDMWFTDVCRNIVLETYQQAEAAVPGSGRRIKVKKMENGRSSIE